MRGRQAAWHGLSGPTKMKARMSAPVTLDRLEGHAYSALAATRMARDVLRRPSGPRTVERVSWLVYNIHRMLALTEPEKLESFGQPGIAGFATLLQTLYGDLRGLLRLMVQNGLGKQRWFPLLREAVDAVGDVLEGLYLSHDPDFRKMVTDAIAELKASRPGSDDPDWRSSLAKVPD